MFISELASFVSVSGGSSGAPHRRVITNASKASCGFFFSCLHSSTHQPSAVLRFFSEQHFHSPCGSIEPSGSFRHLLVQVIVPVLSG